ncbi:MAG: Unknown protein [uncultured Campylobacterales bacterium]|uniref:Phophatidylinositol-4-phosphate 5-kinase n=1 Tax=uncultured Campylobacterales bacterium TaxID=352960 RepID=A0A6S6T6A2_9BACT|nr:MAG: Unknown protein [uncultured Campylobacterales bacterium]
MINISYAVIEDCSQNVNFSNGNTYANITGEITCHRRDTNITTRIVNFKDGKKHGESKTFGGFYSSRGETNKLVLIENYKEGKEDGVFIRYKNGATEQKTLYKDSKKYYEMRIHFSGGKTESFFELQKNGWTKKVGSISYTKVGKLENISCPKTAPINKNLAKLCGFNLKVENKFYSDNEKVLSIQTFLDGKIIEKKLYYLSGKTKAIYRDGIQQFFYENGKLEEEIIKKDKNITTRNYYKDGKLKEVTVSDGRLLQRQEEWYMNEKIKSLKIYKENKEVDIKLYHKSGNLKKEYTQIQYTRYNTKIIGDSKEYYENGKLFINIKRDKEHIIQEDIYYPQGNIKSTTKFYEDKTYSVKEYDKNGNLKKDSRHYSDGSSF